MNRWLNGFAILLLMIGALASLGDDDLASVDGSPTTVSDGLVVWLRASDLRSLRNGQAVTRWPDAASVYVDDDGTQDARQGFHNEPGFPGGAPATYRPLDPPIFVENAGSGFEAVRFDAKQMTGLAHTGGIGILGRDGSDGYTIALVFANTGEPGVVRAAQVGDVEGAGEDGHFASSIAIDVNVGREASFGVRYQNGNTLAEKDDSLDFTLPTLIVCRLGTGERYGKTDLRINGKPALRPSMGDPSGRLRLRDEGYSLGYGNNAAGEPGGFLTGDLYEVRYYNRRISDAALNELESELMERYAIE